jgi:hypothetical protein
MVSAPPAPRARQHASRPHGQPAPRTCPNPQPHSHPPARRPRLTLARCICTAAFCTFLTEHLTTPAPLPTAPPRRLLTEAPYPVDPATRQTQHVHAPQHLNTPPKPLPPPKHTGTHPPHYTTARPTARPHTPGPNHPPSPSSRTEHARRVHPSPHTNLAHQPGTHHYTSYLTRNARWNRPSPDTPQRVRLSLDTPRLSLDTPRSHRVSLRNVHDAPRIHSDSPRSTLGHL